MLNKISAAVVFLLIPFVLFAQNGNQVLKNIQNRFNSVNTLSADFVQTGALSMEKKLSSTKGKLYFQKDNKYRIEFRNLEFISDGSTVWSYNKKNKKVVINDVNNNDASSFSLKRLVYDYPAGSTVELLPQETVSSAKCNVLRLNSKGGRQNFKSVKIWADMNNIIRKAEVTDKSGAMYAFELSNIKINPSLNSGMFSFETPKGSEVIDLR
ncbi:MAG: outer membrane lipoprotein chaperone LolA [Ignavibacteria bacterium]|jgi:chaperone LolA|nr:outer membrane lipoprotein chaperone LolA [Ignavibacteria bacterium]MCU7502620.1 outer membrane lipoprotein chaperone LolA [Ignavibacteria bacterium]MCU7515177.1 outer membrane lipoprotein chaperone LolA [Ignavibacteria bacterium]